MKDKHSPRAAKAQVKLGTLRRTTRKSEILRFES